MALNVSVEIVKYVECCACRSPFHVQDWNTINGQRLPILLTCGHSVCSSCVHKNKGPLSILCLHCRKTRSECLPENSTETANAYLLGHLALVKKKTQKRFDQPVATKEIIEECFECQGVAELGCQQCILKFCRPCWDQVHNGAKSLRLHQKISLEEMKKGTKDTDTCQDHKGQILNFYCQDCEKVLCCHCIVLSHQGHKSSSLEDRNLVLKDELSDVIIDARKQLGVMQQTLSLLELEKPAEDLGAALGGKRKEVLSFFSRLHGLIQQQEEAALKELTAAATRHTAELNNLQKTLRSQIKELSHDLVVAELASRGDNDGKSYNFPRILESLRSYREKPCVIVKESETTCNDVSVSLQSDIFDNLPKLCKINDPRTSDLRLGPIDELPDNVPNSDLLLTGLLSQSRLHYGSLGSDQDRESVTSDPKHTSLCSETSSNEGKMYPIPCAIKSRNPNSYTRTTTRFDNFSRGSCLAVSLSFYQNPAHFYVHTQKSEAVIRNLQRKIKKGKQVDFAVPDMMVIAPYDGELYRAQVLNIKETKVIVKFIDYGNIRSIDKSEIYEAESYLLREPPQAIKCSLYNIHPRNGDWSEKANAKVLEMLGKPNVRMTMIVMKEEGDSLEVDICAQFNDFIGSELVSLRDYLLYFQFGVVMMDTLPEPRKPVGSPLPTFGKRTDIKVNTHFKASIVSVNSPNHFYLIRVDPDVPYLREMTNKMRETYEKSDMGCLYLPVKDAVVAVRDRDVWLRGKIILHEGKLKVYLVDHGKIIPLKISAIRRLHSIFLKCPSLAIRASLSDIKPASDVWDPEAIKLMENISKSNGIFAHVTATDGDAIQVVLSEAGSNISVNQLLITKGYAEGTAISGFSQYNIEKSRKPFVPRKHFSKTPVSSQSENSIDDLCSMTSERSSVEPVEETKVTSEIDKKNSAFGDPTKNTPIGLQVKIIKFLSPSLLYFAFDHYDEALKDIGIRLKHNLSYLRDETRKWTIEEDCAYFSPKYQAWLRGCIVKKEDDDNYEVYATDVLEEEIVSTSNVRELEKADKNVKIVFKSHLVGIKPLESVWSEEASTHLEELLNKADHIFIVNKTDLNETSIPIELFIQETVPSGPLKPASIKCISVNEALVKKGLASVVENYLFGDIMLLENPPKQPLLFEMNSAESLYTPEMPVKQGEESVREVTSPISEIETSKVNISKPSLDWLPARKLTKKRVLGLTTFVDERGVIYFIDSEVDGPVLNKIQREFSKNFKDSRPKRSDQFWSVGQICAARYHLDGCWYRGKILKVGLGSSRTYLVLFVDFGNIETCTVAELRKGVCCLDIPVLCHTCYVSDLRPINGKTYTKDGIDLFHHIAVDKEFLIEVHTSEAEPFPANLTWTKSADDVFDILVEAKLAVRASPGEPFVLPPRDLSGIENLQDIEDEEKSAAKVVDNPRVNNKEKKVHHFPPMVWNQLDLKVLPIQLTSFSHNKVYYAKMVLDDSLPQPLVSLLYAVEKIQQDIRVSSDCLDRACKPAIGSSCIANDGNRFNRCVIENIEGNLYNVFFIDTGERLTVDASEVMECLEDWTLQPGTIVPLKFIKDISWVNLEKLANCLSRVQVVEQHEDFLVVNIINESEDDKIEGEEEVIEISDEGAKAATNSKGEEKEFRTSEDMMRVLVKGPKRSHRKSRPVMFK